MNPISSDIFGRLDWLTNKVKRLLGKFNNLPEYANNAAAKAGGLKNGDVYRTGDVVKAVHS
jgi:hypothetical protein